LGLSLAKRRDLARWTLPPLLIASFVPAVTTALTIKFLFQSSFGIVPFLFSRLASGFDTNILGNPARVFWVFLAADAWQWLPLLTLLFYVGGQDIKQELLDACVIDGGGLFQKVRSVVFPALAPYLVVAAVLRSLETFKIFEPVLLLTGGGPGTATEVIHLYLWRTGFRLWESGYAAALAVITYLVVFVVLAIAFRQFRRVLHWV
jgi:multiple sugar transport system permease protein